jgi:hypothetical protein
MPPLLEAAGRQVDVSLTEGDVGDLEEEDDDVEHIQLGDKVGGGGVVGVWLVCVEGGWGGWG